MSNAGWYYLHLNGSLIYKRDLEGTVSDFRESDFVRTFWPVDPENRGTAWDLLVEAASLGVDWARIKELADKWKCDDEDAEVYAGRVGVKLSRDGARFVARRLDGKGDAEGRGDNALQAMAVLCLQLGYQASKMWGARFRDLLKPAKEPK